MARPTIYTKELANTICSRLAQGESLRAICRDPLMPDVSTVRLWKNEDREGFSSQYEDARQDQTQHLFDELLEIADDGQADHIMRKGSDGKEYEAIDAEHIARSRLRVDTRKWYLSKVLPKVYGDKLDLTSGGDKFSVNVITYAEAKNKESSEDNEAG